MAKWSFNKFHNQKNSTNFTVLKHQLYEFI